MIKSIRLAAAAMLMTAAPVAGFAAGNYTILAAPNIGGGPLSSWEGPGTIGLNGDGVFGSPGTGFNAMTLGGLSSTFGANGAANVGSSGGFTGSTDDVAGSPGGPGWASGGLSPFFYGRPG